LHEVDWTKSNLKELGVRFEIFMAMKIQVVFFWVVALCSNVVGYWHFGGPCCLHVWQKGSPKYWYPTTLLHDVTTQKTTAYRNLPVIVQRWCSN